ncbi:MAG: DUF1573 domain-containing protein [Bacteroidales bacterium]
MNRFYLSLIVALLSITTIHAKDEESAGEATITFIDSKVHDFGYIPEDGGLVTCEFEFINDGDAPLVIINAQSSCGCTIPKYTTKPIKPSKKSSIEVSYNPKMRPGAFKKAIRITTNDPKKHSTLTIIGSVVPAPKKETVEE